MTAAAAPTATAVPGRPVRSANVFALLDRDADGAVTLEDLFWAAEQSAGWGGAAFAPAELRYAFEEADADGDGRLSAGEIDSVLRRYGLAQHEPHERAGVAASSSFAGELKGGLRRLQRQCHLAWSIARLPPEDLRDHEARQALLRRAPSELGKAVAFTTAAVVTPGAVFVVPLLMARFPALVPAAFRVSVPSGGDGDDGARRPAAQQPPADEFAELTARVFGAITEVATGSEAGLSDGAEKGG